MKSNISNSPKLAELKKRRRKAFKRKVLFYLILFLIIFIGISLSSRINKLKINKIEVSGNKIVETKLIEEVINADISGHYFWVFPKSNFLIYPKQKIKNDLATKYKRLKNISINSKNTRTLEIKVDEYDGKYLWCGKSINNMSENIQDNKNCFFLDSLGYIFDSAPYFSGDVYFRFYGGENLNENDPTGNYFEKDIFVNLIKFKDSLNKMNLKTTAFWIDDNGDGNIALSSLQNNGPKIIFKLDANYDKLIENLQSAITTETLQTEIKNKFSSLLYLDLRFNNKVYYKFK